MAKQEEVITTNHQQNQPQQTRSLPIPCGAGGILKHKNTHRNRPKRGVVWDDSAIESQEKERGTRQTITEPKTPYNWDYHSSEDEETYGERIRQQQNDLSNALLAVQTSGNVPCEWDSESKSDHDSSYDEHKNSFEERRRAHYDEWRRIKQLRKQGSTDRERDEEADDEGCDCSL